MSFRTHKVAGEIQKSLSKYVDDFARDHSLGLMTISSVVMSPDLSIAKVYVSVFGTTKTHDDILRLIEQNMFRFKRAITSQLKLRLVPELRFYIDESLNTIDKINAILEANPRFDNSPDEKERD